MARFGVTYQEVAQCVKEILAQGKQPTIEAIRNKLGTGSTTTIANHLRQWRAEGEKESLLLKENLPKELTVIVETLWQKIQNDAAEQIASIKLELEQTLSESQNETEKYKKNNYRWQKLYDQWLIEKNQLVKNKLTLEQALEFSQKENATLTVKQEGLLQQLKDKESRIVELHNLHKQSQENLEHFRHSIKEQRLLDQKQFDQQIQNLQSEVKIVNEELVVQREKNSHLREQYQLLQQSLDFLTTEHVETESNLDQLKKQFDILEKEKNKYSDRSEQWQAQFQECQKELINKTNQFSDQQTELKVLSKAFTDNQKTVEDLQFNNKQLMEEKWLLIQEKALLEGQLKQMHSMVP